MKNQFEQAKVTGDSKQVKLLKAIIDRVESGKSKDNRKA
jgi:hypothetical protein